MRFDWYGATVPASPSQLESVMLQELGGSFADEPAVKNYACGTRHSPSRARVRWGGHNPHPFCEVSGPESPRVATMLRSRFPRHRIARADVCLDYREAGCFDELVALVAPIADAAGVGRHYIESDTGRTLYRGSKKSDVRIRIYEKGIFERSKGIEDAPADWVRLELTVRPRKERKTICVTLSPAEMFGLSRWSGRVLEVVDRQMVPFVPDPSLRQCSDDERALAFMLKQYSGTLQRLRADRGRRFILRQVIDTLDQT